MLYLIFIILSPYTTFAVPPPENPLMCYNIQPLKNITLKQFEGNWVTLSIFEFSEGIPAPSDPEHINECLGYLFENATDTTMDEFAVESNPQHWLIPDDSFNSKIYIKPDNPGIWMFNMSVNTLIDGSEESEENNDDIDDLYVIMADPQLYLIVATCAPTSVEISKHERFVKLLSILSRKDGTEGKILMNEDTLYSLEETVSKLLNFTIVPHIYQTTTC